MTEEPKTKKPIYRRVWFILLAVFFAMGALGALIDEDEPEEVTPVAEPEEEEVVEEEVEESEPIEEEEVEEAPAEEVEPEPENFEMPTLYGWILSDNPLGLQVFPVDIGWRYQEEGNPRGVMSRKNWVIMAQCPAPGTEVTEGDKMWVGVVHRDDDPEDFLADLEAQGQENFDARVCEEMNR